MKATRLAAWAVPLLVLAAAAHSATTINFDGLAPGTGVTNQYAAQGVLFGADPVVDALINIIIANSGLQTSPPNVLAAAGPYTDGFISFSFPAGATDVAFAANSVEEGATASCYDSGNSLLFSQTLTGPNSTTPVFFSYVIPQGGTPIAKVVISAFEEVFADPFAIDDVTFTLVPEPTAVSLLAIGLLAVSRRRR